MDAIKDRKDWLKWRQSGLGASDAYILMGLVDWGTPLSLYESKVADDVEEMEENFAMKLGNESEPKIRALFEMVKDKSFTEALVVMEGYEFIRASLDGYSEDKQEIAEIKLLNKKDWDLARNSNKVPEKYYCQIQHQLSASKAKKAYFVAYLFSAFKDDRRAPLDLNNLAVVEVLPDEKYQADLLAKEVDFWQNNVLKRKPPLHTDKDLVPLTGYSKDVKWYVELKDAHEKLTIELASAKEKITKIVEQTGHNRVLCAGLKFVRVSKKGSFSASKIPEIVNFTKDFVGKMTESDRLKYTGKGSLYWKIDEVKKNE